MLKSEAEIIFNIISKMLLEFKVAMPAKIISFDSIKCLAECKIMLKKKEIDSDYTDYPIINDVPVMFAHAQNALFYLPVQAGDDGLLIFIDRSLENFLAKNHNNTIAAQDSRNHHISDAIFFPVNFQPIYNNPTIPADNTAGLINGEMSLILHPTGKIEIKGASDEVLNLISSFWNNLISIINSIIIDTLVVNGTAATHSPALITLWTDTTKILLDNLKTRLDAIKV